MLSTRLGGASQDHGLDCHQTPRLYNKMDKPWRRPRDDTRPLNTSHVSSTNSGRALTVLQSDGQTPGNDCSTIPELSRQIGFDPIDLSRCSFRCWSDYRHAPYMCVAKLSLTTVCDYNYRHKTFLPTCQRLVNQQRGRQAGLVGTRRMQRWNIPRR